MWRMAALLSACCREGTVVLAAVNDAARRFAAASGAQVGTTEEVAAWEDSHNKKHVKTDWQFTTADGRAKLNRLHPAM
jgi:hypothetical protein